MYRKGTAFTTNLSYSIICQSTEYRAFRTCGTKYADKCMCMSVCVWVCVWPGQMESAGCTRRSDLNFKRPISCIKRGAGCQAWFSAALEEPSAAATQQPCLLVCPCVFVRQLWISSHLFSPNTRSERHNLLILQVYKNLKRTKNIFISILFH